MSDRVMMMMMSPGAKEPRRSKVRLESQLNYMRTERCREDIKSNTLVLSVYNG